MNPDRSPAAQTANSTPTPDPDKLGAYMSVGSLEAPQTQHTNDDEARIAKLLGRRSLIRKLLIAFIVLAILGSGTFLAIHRRHIGQVPLRAGSFKTIQLPLAGLEPADNSLQNAEKLEVNGELQVAGPLLLTPSSQPKNPQSGQIYYDKTSNLLSFYNGQKFIAVGDGLGVTNVNITNLLIGSGNGVLLQSASPGTQQIGNFNVAGTGVVGELQTTIISSNGGTLYVNPIGATAQQQIAAGTPATAGLTTPGSSNIGSGWKNVLAATKVTLGDIGGSATSITAYFEGVSPGDHLQVGLYSDDGDIPSKPAALLSSSASVVMNNGFTTVPIPATNLSANNSYWLVVNTDSVTASRTYNGGSKVSCFISSNFGFMPDPYSPFGCFYDNNLYTIYLNYLRGAGVSGAVSQAAVAVGPTGQALFQNSTDSNTAFQVQNAAGTSTILNVDTLKGNVSIGKATASYKLDIGAGDVNLSNGHSLRFGGLQVLSVNGAGSTTSITNFIPGGKISAQADSFVVQDANATHQSLSIDSNGAATFSNRVNSTTGFQIQNADNSVTILGVDTTSKIVTVTSLVSTGNITVNGHIVTGGSAPAIAAGSAACTAPSISVSGTDTSGTITITTGTGCAAGGTLATVTFATPFGVAPRVLLTPATANAAGLASYIDSTAVSTTSFAIGANTTPADSTTYKWNYIALQ
jgi:hypothetical protein